MTLSEMRRLIEVHGLQLTKSLGQNFLHDGNQLRRIVAAAELQATDRVLEIGPGLGPLTEHLLAGSAHVLAIEKDARLVEILAERFRDEPRLERVHADALHWLRERPRDWTHWKLVANLPYSVGSPLLVDLALAPRPPERLVATLQLEVVQRLVAATNTEAYGLLTLLVGLQFATAGWFKVPRDCFFPTPQVDSACVTLIRRADPLLPPELIPAFTSVVKVAFNQRRKMLRKLLRTRENERQLDAALAAAGIEPTARAEAVGLAGFVALARHLATSSEIPPIPEDTGCLR